MLFLLENILDVYDNKWIALTLIKKTCENNIEDIYHIWWHRRYTSPTYIFFLKKIA